LSATQASIAILGSAVSDIVGEVAGMATKERSGSVAEPLLSSLQMRMPISV
jgi:hypothetical protein